MRQITSRLRHRLQLGAAIAGAVGSVYLVSLGINCATRKPAPRPKPIATVRYVPPPPPPPVMPKVVEPAIPAYQPPHLTAAFAAALKEGDLEAIAAAYTDESSLDVALPAAAAYGNREVVKWVLDRGADVHANENAVDAPLLQADAHPDVVKLLLERGAKDPELSVAIGAGAPNAVGRILAKDKSLARPADGAPIVDAINSAVASEENRTKVVEKLLAAGADPTEGDALNVSLARCSAAESKDICLPITKLLLAKKPTVSGEALASIIDFEDSPARTKLIDTLLGGKLEPDATAIAIAHATGEKDAALVKRIAARGVAWTYHDGEPDAVAPLVDAVTSQDVALVRALIEAGAPVDYQYKDGRSALSAAIDAQAERVVEVLVTHGANVNRRLPDGRSPLFAAAESGNVRIVKAILNAGARVNERVLDETALDAAERSGSAEVARVLDGHGGRRAPPRTE